MQRVLFFFFLFKAHQRFAIGYKANGLVYVLGLSWAMLPNGVKDP